MLVHCPLYTVDDILHEKNCLKGCLDKPIIPSLCFGSVE